jgi:hypothetical protein
MNKKQSRVSAFSVVGITLLFDLNLFASLILYIYIYLFIHVCVLCDCFAFATVIAVDVALFASTRSLSCALCNPPAVETTVLSGRIATEREEGNRRK